MDSCSVLFTIAFIRFTISYSIETSIPHEVSPGEYTGFHPLPLISEICSFKISTRLNQAISAGSSVSIPHRKQSTEPHTNIKSFLEGKKSCKAQTTLSNPKHFALQEHNVIFITLSVVCPNLSVNLLINYIHSKNEKT